MPKRLEAKPPAPPAAHDERWKEAADLVACDLANAIAENRKTKTSNVFKFAETDIAILLVRYYKLRAAEKAAYGAG